jgi:hypothetical protein
VTCSTTGDENSAILESDTTHFTKVSLIKVLGMVTLTFPEENVQLVLAVKRVPITSITENGPTIDEPTLAIVGMGDDTKSITCWYDALL